MTGYVRILLPLLAALLALPLVAYPGDDAVSGETPPPSALFDTSHQCMACHNGLVNSVGRDISIATDWRPTMMANSSRDPYWQATVRRESLDHPAAVEIIEDECSICHMPMARYTAHWRGEKGHIFVNFPGAVEQTEMSTLSADGVSCTMCHQIGPENLGQRESFVGRFKVDENRAWGERHILGPFDVDAGRTRIMSSSSLFEPHMADHIRDSGLCGSCHTLYTHALGPDGEVIGELAEQMPYLEWLHSRYPQERSCQSCHMHEAAGLVHISSVWGQPREGFMQHVFKGGNFLVPLLLNKHRDTLAVAAKPNELQAMSDRTTAHLQEKAAVVNVSGARIEDGHLEFSVMVGNLAGHKLPSAYPSRRAWLHVQVRDEQGKLLFESGRLRPDGSIEGNDNDADAALFEPHYTVVDAPDEVQIYEPILGGPDDKVTTGLLAATHYLKDNRLLPEGFDKATAGKDIAVAGGAKEDADFTGGGDTIVYKIALGKAGGQLTIEARLYYQPIGFRWAQNLKPYDAHEPRRFVGYYEEAAPASAVVLASGLALTVP